MKPYYRRVSQYRCITCGNISNVPTECCGEPMIADPLEEPYEEELYFIENKLLNDQGGR